MKSAKRGSNIFPTEVTNISCNGIWMLIDDQEMFLAFEHFPWFQEKITQINMINHGNVYLTHTRTNRP